MIGITVKLFRQNAVGTQMVAAYIRVCVCDFASSPEGGICACGGAVASKREIRLAVEEMYLLVDSR